MSESSRKILPQATEAEVDSWMNLSAAASAEEQAEERLPNSLRPTKFDEYVGQESILENLKISCDAAVNRKESLDHVLLHGPPGLGKTSLSRIIAGQLGVGFKSTSGPVIERPGDLAAILTSLEHHDVLFIDEIHRLSRVVEEVLYPAMEDFELDILIGQGPAAKSVKIEVKPFTLIGATTRTGLLTSPLRDRFGLSFRLGFYSAENLTKIIKRSASLLGIEIEDQAAFEIGCRSRGTPRIANRLLKRVRDFADRDSSSIITQSIASSALEMLDVDERGLDAMDRLILETIMDKFEGGPVGIETIAAAVGEERETIEEVYEPYLVQEGFIARTRRGRELTSLAHEHLARRRSGA